MIGLAIILYGCSTKINFTGKYISKNGPNYIELKADSTFIYEYRMFHLYQRSFGKWDRKNERFAQLNSDIKYTNVPLIVSAVNNNGVETENNISIDLKIKEGFELVGYRCRIYINDKIYLSIRADSLHNIPIREPINDIFFHILKEPKIVTSTYISPPIITDQYNPKNNQNNKLKIEINVDDSYFYYRVFNMNPVIIKKNKIKLFNPHENKWEKLFKVSNKMNIFSSFLDEH